MVAQAYRQEHLTRAEVGRVLGHATRWETDAFLKAAGAYLHYTVEDLQDDIETLREITG